ncbi:hypothetical protein Tco_1113055 [Tanacetum coccineum]|uniref:Uncharacterized protein n=1 Tax=Tanacetum coccineum TaxID=301880 RepID=A0ABQ5ITF5_9ASTR
MPSMHQVFEDLMRMEKLLRNISFRFNPTGFYKGVMDQSAVNKGCLALCFGNKQGNVAKWDCVPEQLLSKSDTHQWHYCSCDESHVNKRYLDVETKAVKIASKLEKNKDVAAKDGVSPFVTDEPVVKEKQSSLVDTSIPTAELVNLSSLDDTTVLVYFPPLSTPVTTTTGNALGKSLYANITGKPSGKKVNVHTLFTPGGNGIDVVISVDSIRAISERFANTAYGFFLGKKVAYHVVAKYECPKNTGVGEKKTVKKPSQASRGVPVGPKMAFKPQKEYRPVTKKPNTSSSGNKKKGVEPTIEVSNSNPFDVLNSVDNDVEFGTNRGTSNLGNNEATPSGSSFMNIDNDGEFASNTPIGEKINKIERQIGEGKLRLLDNDENPLVPTGIVESDSEVDVVYDETANLMIPTSGNDRSDKCYSTNSLLEQWRDSYPDNDDYDPYDDDMYKNHDLSEHLQSICDYLDITVRGRKKK